MAAARKRPRAAAGSRPEPAAKRPRGALPRDAPGGAAPGGAAPGGAAPRGAARGAGAAEVRPTAAAKAAAAKAASRRGGGRRGGGRRPVFVSLPGAGGGRSRHGLLEEFGDVSYASFEGRPNLTSPEREAPFLEQIIAAAAAAATGGRPLYLTGHSFGARAVAHLLGRPELRRRLPGSFGGALLFGYPLAHPTQRREGALRRVPRAVPLLLLSGTRDPFAGDFSLLGQALAVQGLPRWPAGPRAAPARGRRGGVVKVEGGDHGLACQQGLEAAARQTVLGAVAAFLGRPARVGHAGGAAGGG